jgi:aminoglycoside phosphotransferase family enzyme/predicted kinase
MPQIDLPDHVESLQRPEVFPHPVDEVQLVQTAISYVLIAGEHVYKLKKPVALGFLDFTTLEKRLHYCNEEVRLNARGCPGLHLGVEPVVRRADGEYRLGGEGEVVDYAVHMRRLPQDRMMDEMVERDEVTLDMIGRLVARLFDLYSQAERGDRINEIGGYETLAANWHENFAQVEPYIGRSLSRRRFERIQQYIDAFLAQEEPLLRRRVEEGWVRDCHGDLRSDSVCFDPAAPDGICLYDCIEFNERFRYGDTGLDAAFLAMDLDFRGRPDLSDLFVGLYIAAMGDKELPLLLDFYECYRAVVRGKVESMLLDDEDIDRAHKTRARKRAQQYFDLAESYATKYKESRARAYQPFIAVMGLSGSGKSVLAGALAARLGAVLLSTDMLRPAAEASGARRGTTLDADRYSTEARAAVYEQVFEQTRSYLDAGRPVVMDGTFVERRQRYPVLELGRELHGRFLVVECVAAEEVVKQRQAQRANETWSRSEGRWEVYQAQKKRYDPPEEIPTVSRITVDTSTPLAEQLDAVSAALSPFR